MSIMLPPATTLRLPLVNVMVPSPIPDDGDLQLDLMPSNMDRLVAPTHIGCVLNVNLQQSGQVSNNPSKATGSLLLAQIG